MWYVIDLENQMSEAVHLYFLPLALLASAAYTASNGITMGSKSFRSCIYTKLLIGDSSSSLSTWKYIFLEKLKRGMVIWCGKVQRSYCSMSFNFLQRKATNFWMWSWPNCGRINVQKRKRKTTETVNPKDAVACTICLMHNDLILRISFKKWKQQHFFSRVKLNHVYRKVASSRLVYYSIFDHFGGITNWDVLLLQWLYYKTRSFLVHDWVNRVIGVTKG